MRVAGSVIACSVV